MGNGHRHDAEPVRAELWGCADSSMVVILELLTDRMTLTTLPPHLIRCHIARSAKRNDELRMKGLSRTLR